MGDPETKQPNEDGNTANQREYPRSDQQRLIFFDVGRQHFNIVRVHHGVGLTRSGCVVGDDGGFGISDGEEVGAVVSVGSCSGVLVSVGARVGIELGEGGGVSDGTLVGVVPCVGSAVG